MTQEQARQEAVKRIKQTVNNIPSTLWNEAITENVYSINREIELLERISKNTNIISTIFSELQDLNQIKDELLKM